MKFRLIILLTLIFSLPAYAGMFDKGGGSSGTLDLNGVSSGILYNNSGQLTTASAGTDYQSPLSAATDIINGYLSASDHLKFAGADTNATVSLAGYNSHESQRTGTWDGNVVDANKIYAPTKGGACIVVSAYDTPIDVCMTADYKCSDNNAQTILTMAAAALPSSGGKLILLPGTYTVNPQVTWIITESNLIVEGYGAVFKTHAISNHGGMIRVGNGINAVNNVVIRGLNAYETPYDNTHENNFLTANFHSYNTTFEDLDMTCGSGFNLNGDKIRIINCRIEYTGHEAIQLSNGLYGSGPNDVLITGCYLSYNQQTNHHLGAIYVGYSNKVLISNCIISNCYTNAINLINDINVIVEDCILLNNQTGTNTFGDLYLVTAGASGLMNNCLISNNVIMSPGALYSIRNDISVGSGVSFVNNLCKFATTNSVYTVDENATWLGNTGDYKIPDRKVENWWNISGSTIAPGSLVVKHPDTNDDTFNTSTNLGDSNVIGMALDNITNNTRGKILRYGKTTLLKVNGVNDISVGDLISNFDQNGIGQKANSNDKVFAQALEAYATDDSNGVIDAMLFTPYYYTNSVPVVQNAYLTADVNLTDLSFVTLTMDKTINLKAGHKYVLNGILYLLASSSTINFVTDVNGTALATTCQYGIQAGNINAAISAWATAVSAYSVPSGTRRAYIINSFIIAQNDGTLVIDGENAAGSNTITVYSGSWLRVWEQP